MTREQALQEVEARRAADPEATWLANEKDGVWRVVRVGIAPSRATGTATHPAPEAPRDDPGSSLSRAAWTVGAG